MITRQLFALTLLVGLLVLLALTQPASLAQTVSTGGISNTTFATPQGKVTVYLPDDMRAGDTISGTVVTEPTGANEAAKQRNSGELQGYVIALENQKSPVSSGVLQGVHLAESSGAPNLLLLDANGKQIGSTPLKLASGQLAPVVPGTFSFPTLGQTGRPIEIHGPFDGDFGNTKVTIGGVEPKLIAESPRKVVVQTPPGVVGPSNITVNENGTAATGAFRNLKLDLTAPKTALRRGESTELHVGISGLEGLSQPVRVEVQNQTPSIVNLAGGNTQNIVVNPTQVQPGGTFPWGTTVTGTGSGSFMITTNVLGTSPGTTPSPTPTPTQPAPTSSPDAPAPTSTTTGSSAVVSGPSVSAASPSPTPDGLIDGSFTAVATDCCKKFMQSNGVISFTDDNGNGFKLDKNVLIMFMDGQRYEWEFTQDGQPFPVAWMFCHLNDHQIISQLTNVMAQRVSGGSTTETSSTVSVGLAGPYRSEKTNKPFYGFQFGAQKVGTKTNEYSVGFSMDAATCRWSWRLFADGKVREFSTDPGFKP